MSRNSNRALLGLLAVLAAITALWLAWRAREAGDASPSLDAPATQAPGAEPAPGARARTGALDERDAAPAMERAPEPPRVDAPRTDGAGVVVGPPAVPEQRFHGLVVAGESGVPLAGAQLFDAMRRRTPVLQVTPGDAPLTLEIEPRGPATDASGRFELRADDLRVGHVVGVSAEGRGTAYFPLSPGREDAAEPQVVELWRAASLVLRVRGFTQTRPERFELVASPTALLPYGVPRPGLAPRTFAAALDANGSGELEELAPRAPLALSVVGADGRRFPVDMLTFEPGERRQLDWDFGGGAVLAGRALDQHGLPVAGLELALSHRGPAERGQRLWYRQTLPAEQVFARARTDEVGRFRIEEVPAGRWWLGPVPRATANDEPVSPVAEALDVRAGESLLELEPAIWIGLTFRGRIEGPDRPTSGEWVRSECASIAGQPRVEYDGQRGFELGPVAGLEHELWAVEMGGAGTTPRVRALPGEGEVVLRFAEHGGIELELYDATGAPVDGAMILIVSQDEPPAILFEGCTGDRFSWDQLGPGEHLVVAYTNDYRAGALHGVEVRPGETRRGLRLELAAAAQLELRHAGAQRATYELRLGGHVFGYEHLEPGGRTSALVPAGAFEVRARGADGPGQRIELAPGEEGVLELGR